MKRLWAWIKEFFGFPPKLIASPRTSADGFGWSIECDAPVGPCGCGVIHKPLPLPSNAYPTVDEVIAAASKLNNKPWCHDRRCKGHGKHDCHDLACKEHVA